MRSRNEIMAHIASIEVPLAVDTEEGYIDEGEQAEVAALRWVLDRDIDEALINEMTIAEAKYQGLM